MNISELNQALNAIADEVTDDSKTRLASVNRRVRVARRSKVAGTIVTTCAAVMAFVFLPNWGDLPGTDQTGPAATAVFGNLDTVRDGNLLFYKDAGGVRLLKERVGAAGAHSVSFSVTPRSGNIGWTQPCPRLGAGPVQFHLSVNGSEVPGAALESRRYTGAARLSGPNTTCDDVTSPLQVARVLSFSPTGNVAAWQRFEVHPEQPSLFTLSVTAPDTPAGHAALAKATVALAVYEIPRHPVHARITNTWVERHIVDPPAASGAFKLAHRKFVKVGPGRTQLSVPVPHTGKQIYVRTFVVHGEGSGITLGQGAPTRNELKTVSGPLSVEKSIAAGPSTVRAAVATVPAGVTHWVAILVYVRYQ
jgi:hypothetical protein